MPGSGPRWNAGTAAGSPTYSYPGCAPGGGADIAPLLGATSSRSRSERFIARSAERAGRNRRLKRGAVAALAALTVIAAVLAAVARYQARRAEEAALLAKANENRANAQARLANSRRIAALSVSERGQRLDVSLILAVEALQIEDSYEARMSLFDALHTRPGIVSFLFSTEGRVESVAFSPEGRTVAAVYRALGDDPVGGVVLCDVASQERLADIRLAVNEGPVTSGLQPRRQDPSYGYRPRWRRRGGAVGCGDSGAPGR